MLNRDTQFTNGSASMIPFPSFQNIRNKSGDYIESALTYDVEDLMETLCRDTKFGLESIKSGTLDKCRAESLLSSGREALSKIIDNELIEEKAHEFIFICRKLGDGVENERKELSTPLRKELASLKAQGDRLVNGLKEMEMEALSKMQEWAINNLEKMEETDTGYKIEGERGTFFLKEEQAIIEIDASKLPMDLLIPNEKLITQMIKDNMEIKGVKTEATLVGSYRCKSGSELF